MDLQGEEFAFFFDHWPPEAEALCAVVALATAVVVVLKAVEQTARRLIVIHAAIVAGHAGFLAVTMMAAPGLAERFGPVIAGVPPLITAGLMARQVLRAWRALTALGGAR